MVMPDWTWRWAWNGVITWAGVRSIQENLTARERFSVAAAVLGPGIRHYYVRPVRDWLYRRLPVRVLLQRLEPSGHGWHRVPDQACALHAFFRFGMIVHEGDFLRVLDGTLVAIGLIDEELDRCEFWFADELDKPDPPPAVKLARRA